MFDINKALEELKICTNLDKLEEFQQKYLGKK
jgi:hypothetical protein